MSVGFVAAIVGHVARFGYDFGNSDQDELLPAVYRVLSDNRLFSNDWLVSFQTSTFNVRTPTITIVAKLSAILSTFDAVLFLYLLSAAGVFLAVYRIASRSGERVWTPWLSGLAIFVLTKGFTLGGNDVMNTMYVPSMTGWAISLWSLSYWLDDRPVLAGVLAALTVPIQALIGLQTALMLGLASVFLLIWTRERAYLKHIARFSLSFVLLASWPVYALLSAQADALTVSGGVDPFLEILARIRAPHHFIPTYFPARSVIKFASLAALGSLALTMTPKSADKRKYSSLLAAVFVCCFVAFLFVEVWPVATIVKMQMFRLTVYAKVICIVVLVQTIFLSFRTRLGAEPGSDNYLNWRRTSFGILAAVILLASVQLWSINKLEFELRSRSNWGEVERWSEAHTAVGDVFVVAPSNSHFRSNARRAIFVNYKAVPFSPSYLTEWLHRIEILTGTDTIPDGVSMDWLDQAFAKLSISDMAAIIGSYGIDYVVRNEPFDSVEPVFRSGDLNVYSAESIALVVRQ